MQLCTVLLQLVAPPPCANLNKWRLKKKCKFLPWNSLKRVATHLELHYFVYWPFARRSKMFSNLLLCLMSFWYHSIVHAYTPAHPSSSLFFPILFQELFVLRWSKVFSETLIEVIFGAWNVFSIEGTFNFLKLEWFLFCSKLWIIFWSWPKQKHVSTYLLKNFLLEKVCLLFFIWNNKLSFEECSKLVPKCFLFGRWQSFRHNYKKLGAYDFNFKSAKHVNNQCVFNTWKFAREISTFFLQKLS